MLQISVRARVSPTAKDDKRSLSYWVGDTRPLPCSLRAAHASLGSKSKALGAEKITQGHVLCPVGSGWAVHLHRHRLPVAQNTNFPGRESLV